MPDADFDDTPRFCSRCGLPIVVEGAGFCKDCGAPVGQVHLVRGNSGQRAAIAFLLSIVPGLGHIYQGRVSRGVTWFFGVIIAYSAGPIGYLLHLICALSAASYASNRYHERRSRRRIDRVPAQY